MGWSVRVRDRITYNPNPQPIIHRYALVTITITLYPHVVNAIVGAHGSERTQITVRENWGKRVVVRGSDGKEQILWVKDLFRYLENKHGVQTPYEAYSHNKWNRIKLLLLF